MAYKVVVTNDAKENMQEYIEYILYEKKNHFDTGRAGVIVFNADRVHVFRWR